MAEAMAVGWIVVTRQARRLRWRMPRLAVVVNEWRFDTLVGDWECSDEGTAELYQIEGRRRCIGLDVVQSTWVSIPSRERRVSRNLEGSLSRHLTASKTKERALLWMV